MTKRATLYVRVSTDEQADKFSIPSQLRELRALAQKKGYEIPSGYEFVDDGYSGENTERPALTKLRTAVRARAVDVVLAYDPDRLARRLSIQCVLADEIEAAGASLEFLNMERANTPDGRLFFNIRGAFAEYEREKIRERTARGRMEMARLGHRPPAKAPYGYIMDKAARRIVVHEGEAAVVRQIFAWAEAGRSIRSMMMQLRQEGIRTRKGSPWAISSVQYLLKYRPYIGEGVYNVHGYTKQAGLRVTQVKPEAEWVRFALPSIITPPIFARVQQRLARNKEVVVGRRATRQVYVLRGLLRCGYCGKRYSGMSTKGNRLVYRCNGNNSAADTRCSASLLQAEVIEGQVWRTISNLIRNPEALRQDIEQRAASLGAQDAEIRSAVEHVKRQLSDVQRRERRLLDLYMVEEKASPDAVRAKMNELGDERRLLEARLRDAEEVAKRDGVREQQYAAVAAWCARVRRGLDRLDRAGQQQLLREAVERIVVTPEAVEITTSFANALPVVRRDQSPSPPPVPSEEIVQCALPDW
jgi:site-specific DNA recombinase